MYKKIQMDKGKMGMKYGYWTPIFGGWLRNVEDEKYACHI